MVRSGAGANAENLGRLDRGNNGRAAGLMRRVSVSLRREAVDAPGAATRCGVRTILVRVRGVPRRQRTGRIAVRPKSVRVTDLADCCRGIGRPVSTREP